METIFTLGQINVPTTARPGKGKSIIAFPEDYCVVDVETTGLSPEWNDIIEIGAVHYQNGVEIEHFQSLVQPPAYDDGTYIPSFIEKLTGITNEMLADAPSSEVVIPQFLAFLKDSFILGYNVNFDVNFLYECCDRTLDKPFTNDFMDIMRLARKLYPDLAHHRLKDMVAYLGLVNEREHRTLTDCRVTEQVFEKLHAKGLEVYGSDEGIIKAFKKKHYAGPRVADIQGDESKADPECPIYQQHCVITGKLERFTRTEALQLIADLGGINESSVTKKTNFLILGNNDYCATIKDGKSSKQKKAEELKLKGQDIEIMPETVFYDMITDSLN